MLIMDDKENSDYRGMKMYEQSKNSKHNTKEVLICSFTGKDNLTANRITSYVA
jgi:hypothetical protein